MSLHFLPQKSLMVERAIESKFPFCLKNEWYEWRNLPAKKFYRRHRKDHTKRRRQSATARRPSSARPSTGHCPACSCLVSCSFLKAKRKKGVVIFWREPQIVTDPNLETEFCKLWGAAVVVVNILWQSEFKSSWSLQFFSVNFCEKNENKLKRGWGWHNKNSASFITYLFFPLRLGLQLHFLVNVVDKQWSSKQSFFLNLYE